MNSRRVNETTIQLNAFMRDVKNGNLRTILVNLQKMCDYQSEKLRIYEKHLTELTGKARLELTDSDKRRLAQKGKALNSGDIAGLVQFSGRRKIQQRQRWTKEAWTQTDLAGNRGRSLEAG